MFIFLIGIAILLDVVLLSWLTEKEEPNPFWSIFIIGGSVATWHYLISPLDFTAILSSAQDNILLILGYVLVWLVAGVIWSFIRWFFLLKKSKREQLRKYNILYKEAEKTIHSNRIDPIKYNIPEAADNKFRIITWMIYWPFSLIGYVGRNPVARLYNAIYNSISGYYDKMATKVFN